MASSWSIAVVGWLVIPIIHFVLNKLLSYLRSDTSEKLKDLEINTIPNLEQTLTNVTEKRMLIEAKDGGKGSESELATLHKKAEKLRSALYEAEDILDLVGYHRMEKKAMGDGNSRGTWLLVLAISKGSSWFERWIQVPQEKVQQSLSRKFEDLRAKVLQRTQGSTAEQPTRDALSASSIVQVGVDIERGSAAQPPTPNASLNLHVTSRRCPSIPSWPTIVISALRPYWDSSHQAVAKMIIIFYQILLFVIPVLRGLISLPGLCLNWTYEAIGIQRDAGAIEWFVPVTEIIRVRRQIERIQGIPTDPKTSDIHNQNVSSSTAKDTDKESSDSRCKDKESSVSRCKQKEIDDSIEKVFGRDKDRESICDMLRGEECYSVIGIYGITGSGKSTLAKYVCNYEETANYFNPIMIISVRKTFSGDDIFHRMLEEIKPSQPSNDKRVLDSEGLKEELKKSLQGKRILLVLDDVWPVNAGDPQRTKIIEEEQEFLLKVLRAGQNGSRILVTTQREDAAQDLGAQKPWRIRDLEDKEYENLFMHHALQGTADNDRHDFVRIGRKIIEKLHRSPIAAVAVAKQLRNRSIGFWEDTSHTDMSDEIIGALWWSYQQLRADTRRCFAYCSTFPRGYEFKRDELVRIWIAQGFAKTKSGSTEQLEDVGLRCFQELLKFSFLQQTMELSIETFTIHDQLHKLAEKIAGGDFFRIDGSNGLIEDIQLGVHHLFIQSKNGDQVTRIAESDLELGNLRTLIIKVQNYTFKDGVQGMEAMERNHGLEKTFEGWFMRLRKLRVLIVELNTRTKVLSFPASIEQMKNLRYLGFSFLDCKELIFPGTFSKLYHMQTIDILPLYLSVSYPEDMANLIHLRHISGSWPVFPNVGRLRSLQEMEHFCVKKEQGYELKQLEHLNLLRGGLNLDGLENVGSREEALEAHLSKKEHVTRLSMCYRNRDSDPVPVIEEEVLEELSPPKYLRELTILGYNGSRYPSWMLSGQHPYAPKNLSILKFIACSSPLKSSPNGNELFIHLRELWLEDCDWDSLPENMDRLESLQILDICWYAGQRDKIGLVPTLPRSLKEIRICGWDCLLENMEHLESLEKFSITFCNKMELLPTLPLSLKRIWISECRILNKTLKNCQHENWNKIKHIDTAVIFEAEDTPSLYEC